MDYTPYIDEIVMALKDSLESLQKKKFKKMDKNLYKYFENIIICEIENTLETKFTHIELKRIKPMILKSYNEFL